MNKLLKIHTFTLLMSILGFTASAQAAVLTFDTGLVTNNASGDSILNDGAFVLGVNVGGSADATINGVDFTGQTGTSINYTDNGVTFASTSTSSSSSFSGTPGYTNAGLNVVLDSGQFTNNVSNGSDSVSFSFSGLTIGEIYRVQILTFQAGAAGASGRNSVLFNGSDAGNFSATAMPSDTVAAFITATWEADATTQSFLLTPEVTDPALNRRAALDGISLFVVPEPNSIALLGMASGLLFLRRRRR